MSDEQRLLESLEAEAKAEREQVLGDAGAEASRLRETAEAAVSRAVEEARRRGEKLGTVEVDRRVGIARHEVGLAVLAEKHAALGEVRGTVAGKLTGLRDRKGYTEALERWTTEVLAGLGEGTKVLVHPDDVATVKKLVTAAAPGMAVEPDKGIDGGVKAVSSDGRVVADSTLSARLVRAEQRLDEIIGNALFADEG